MVRASNRDHVTKAGKLIVCPTPLGNLGDITKRTLEAFESCDVVCCEDTRITGKLLNALGLHKPLERLDEATLSKKADQIVSRISRGEVIAYASDAGMPGVSDPGQRLVDAARRSNATVEVLPGPTALTTAYVASGFSAQSFFFGAFFPRKEGERKRLLEQLKQLDSVLIFYESPLRLVSALRSLNESMPFRHVAVCRELTKVHEEVFRGTIADVLVEFEDREKSNGIKGEIVIVIDAPNDYEIQAEKVNTIHSAEDRLLELLADGTMTKKDIIGVLRNEFGLSRNDAYDLVHRH